MYTVVQYFSHLARNVAFGKQESVLIKSVSDLTGVC